MNEQALAIKKFAMGDDAAAESTGLKAVDLKNVREAWRLLMADGEPLRLHNAEIQRIASERRDIVLKATRELYPDFDSIPSNKAVAEHTGLPVRAVESSVASLKKAKKWKWRQPIDRKKLGLASATPYKGQRFDVAVNFFVQDYVKKNRGNVPSVSVIAKTLGRSEKYTIETIADLKKRDKWPVKGWA